MLNIIRLFFRCYHETVATYNLPLDLVPIFPKPKTVSMQKDDVKLLYEWVNTHGKCVRQRTVRQETASYKCGTLPLSMCVSTSIEGTEVTFDHIDEYHDSESGSKSGLRVTLSYLTSCLPMMGGSLRLLPPLKLVAMI